MARIGSMTSYSVGLHTVSMLGSLVLTGVCCYPVVNFLTVGWRVKKESITSSFSTNAKKIYLASFLNRISKNPDTDFETVYEERYSKTNFRMPLILLIAILIPTMYLFCQTAIAYIFINGKQISQLSDANAYEFTFLFPTTAASALAGAYLWIVADLCANLRRNDFRPSWVLLSTLRLVASVPVGYAVASLANSTLASFAAFAISAFPLDQVRVLFRRIASDKLGLKIGTDGEPDQVNKISGIDSVVADTLQDVGITTIPQLAYCDPVQLSIKTGFEFPFVVDVVGQALAWLYFGDKLTALRVIGLRASVEIGQTLVDSGKVKSITKQRSEATLRDGAKVVGVGDDAFLNACDQIADDPYNKFLTEIWDGTGLLPEQSDTVPPAGSEIRRAA